MDFIEFSSLDASEKIDYVIDLLKEAKALFLIIQTDCPLGVDSNFVQELERIGDKLFEYSELVRLGFADYAFEGLHREVSRLHELAGGFGGTCLN